MESKTRTIAGDIVLLSLFPLTATLFLLSLSFSHRTQPYATFASLGLYVSFASLILLPLWAALRILRNRARTRASVIWLESGLGGMWLFAGLYLALMQGLGRVASLAIALLAGIALSLVPLRRSRSAKSIQ